MPLPRRILRARAGYPARLIGVALAISGIVPAAYVGIAFSFVPTVVGGSGTKTFSLTGSLPSGFSFSTTTGAITASSPSAASSTAGLNITVTDASGSASLGAFTLVVAISNELRAVSVGDSIFSIRSSPDEAGSGNQHWAHYYNTSSFGSYGAGSQFYGNGTRECVGWFDLLTGGVHAWHGLQSPLTDRNANYQFYSNGATAGKKLIDDIASTGNWSFSKIAAQYVPLTGGTAIFEGGVNDIFGLTGSYTATSFNNLQSAMQNLIAQARALGMRMLLVPILHSTRNTSANFITTRTTYNSWLYGLTDSDIAVANIDGFDAKIHSQGDGLHPNALGAYVVGKAMADAWKAKFGTTSASPLFSVLADANQILASAKAAFTTGGGTVAGGASGTVGNSWALNGTGLTQTFAVPTQTAGAGKSLDVFAEVKVDAGMTGLIGLSIAVSVDGSVQCKQQNKGWNCPYDFGRNVIFDASGNATSTYTSMFVPASDPAITGVLRNYLMPIQGSAGTNFSNVTIALGIGLTNVASDNSDPWTGSPTSVMASLESHPVYGNWQKIVISDGAGGGGTVRFGRVGARIVNSPTYAGSGFYPT